MASRRSRSTRWITAAIALVIAAPVSGHAAPGEGQTPEVHRQRPTHPIQHGGVRLEIEDGAVTREQAPRTMAEALANFEEAPTVFDMVDATESLIRTWWGIEPIGGIPDRIARSTASPRVAASHLDGEVEWASMGVGDLDGDGLDDVIALKMTYGSSAELSGRSGLDGSELWSIMQADEYGFFPLPAPDLTGDGTADLVTLDIDVEYGGSTCAVVACQFTDSAVWSLAVRSGLDGSTVWEHTYDAAASITLAGAGAIAAGAFAGLIDVTYASVFPVLSDDHDGDGLPDLIVNTWDLKYGYVVGSAGIFAGGLVYLLPHAITSRAAIIGSTDGSDIARLDSPEHAGIATVLPAGDAVGDATGDVVRSLTRSNGYGFACAFAVLIGYCASADLTSSMTVDMFDGTDIAEAWSRTDPTQDDFAAAFPVGEDLDGDGSADLAVRNYTTVGGVWLDTDLAMWSGADGSEMWRNPYWWSMPVGSLDGGPGTDLVTILDFGYDPVEVEILRIDGATGSEIGLTTHTLDTDYYVTAYSPGDADADGVADIALESMNWDGNGYQTDILVESIKDESVLWSEALGDVYSYPAGDLDGDGTGDILLNGREAGTNGVEVTVEARSLPTGGALWSSTSEIEPYSYTWAAPGGDMDGDGGRDVLLHRTQYLIGSDTLESRVDGLAGATGDHLWGFGSPLSPVSIKGAMGGTVTNEDGDPIMYACIDIHTLGGSWIDYADSAADGSWLVNWIPPGDYKVVAYDCYDGIYQDEWYDDKATFEDADPVTVTPGDTTTIHFVLSEY